MADPRNNTYVVYGVARNKALKMKGNPTLFAYGLGCTKCDNCFKCPAPDCTMGKEDVKYLNTLRFGIIPEDVTLLP